jgi:hypothetical protein
MAYYAWQSSRQHVQSCADSVYVSQSRAQRGVQSHAQHVCHSLHQSDTSVVLRRCRREASHVGFGTTPVPAHGCETRETQTALGGLRETAKGRWHRLQRSP